MSDQRDVQEPEEEHVQSTNAKELATEDAVEGALERDTGFSPVDAHEESGSATADPGRQNPIIPGEGKIDEPT